MNFFQKVLKALSLQVVMNLIICPYRYSLLGPFWQENKEPL